MVVSGVYLFLFWALGLHVYHVREILVPGGLFLWIGLVMVRADFCTLYLYCPVTCLIV
jgi:hypothetical protein